MTKTKTKKKLFRVVRNLFLHFIGSLIMCGGFAIFINANNLLGGGLWGLSAVLHHFLPQITLPVFLVLLNLPLMIWAWRELDLEIVAFSIINILVQSALLTYLDSHFQAFIQTYIHTDNLLLACIFGGVLTGFGSGLIIKYYGASGGLDIVGIILKKKTDISVGNIILIGNAIVVSLAAFISNLEIAMYTMVCMYISSNVFNWLLEGTSPKRQITIICNDGQKVADNIMLGLGRGVTIIDGQGAYTHLDKSVLLCIISRYEVPKIRELIREADPNAFVSVNEVKEVMGRFKQRKTKAQLEKMQKEHTTNS